MCKCYFPSCVGDSCANYALVVAPVFIVEGLLYVFQLRGLFLSFLLSHSFSLLQTYWESRGASLLPYALLLSQVGYSSLCRPKPLLRKCSSWVYSSYWKLTMCHSFIDHRLKRKQWASRCWKSPLFLDSVHEVILCLDRWDLGCVNTYTYPHTHAHMNWHHCYHVVIL